MGEARGAERTEGRTLRREAEGRTCVISGGRKRSEQMLGGHYVGEARGARGEDGGKDRRDKWRRGEE